VRIVSPEAHQLLVELPVAALEIGFSPRGTFLSTLERYVKNEDGSQNKNLRVWNAENGAELASFSQRASDGWWVIILSTFLLWPHQPFRDIQYTPNETYAVRLSGDVQVFNPRKDEPWDPLPASKLRIENCTSVSLSPNSANPHIAAFVPERKGAPAIIRLLPLLTLSTGTHTAQKTFFKSDRVQVKWNAHGTMLLCMTHTDVDKTNKSYYGETGMYLISAAGNYDARVVLGESPMRPFRVSSDSSPRQGRPYPRLYLEPILEGIRYMLWLHARQNYHL
jgi:translation initiation factor 2A